MEEPRTIAFVASDPGGANALLPVMLRLIARPSIRLVALSYRQAVEIWQKQGLKVNAIEESFDLDRARALLRENQVHLLVAGTSLNSLEVEKKLITAAHEAGIPTLGILDFYDNYLERFSDQRGPFSCLPDRVAVLDDFSRGKMQSLGAPPERVVVTGQPAFDGLARMRRASRAAARTALGVARGEKLVTFISQPLIEMYGQDPNLPAYPGYDQHMVLGQIMDSLDVLSSEGCQLHLAVRIHPREDPAWFKSLCSPSVQIRCYADNAVLRGMLASDLVIGMTSTLLLEAAYLGCVCLSIQPNTRRAFDIPAIAHGYIPAIYDSAQIEPTVRGLLFEASRRQEIRSRLLRFVPDSRATQRVIQLIQSMLQWRR